MRRCFVIYMRESSEACGVAEEGDEGVKTLEGISSKLGQGLAGALEGFGWLFETAFREELIGIADDFFLEALGQEVARRRDGQLLGNNLGRGDACSRMTLADASVAVEAHAVEHLAPENAMQDIGFGTITVDARGIGTAHAYVVQHGGFFNKLNVDGLVAFYHALTEGHCQVGHLTAMMNQHPVIIITGCVVSLDD